MLLLPCVGRRCARRQGGAEKGEGKTGEERKGRGKHRRADKRKGRVKDRRGERGGRDQRKKKGG